MPPIAGYRLAIALPGVDAEHLGEHLADTLDPPPGAVSLFEDKDGLWCLECFFEAKPDESALAALTDALIPGAAVKLKLEAIESQDWAAKSQAMLHPVGAGRFVVHGSHDRDQLPPSRWRIEIDAGQAFGTAHHGSTLGCLELLHGLASKRRFRHILDLGTGSGILAIAAARLWSCAILATDNDPVAITVARANARHNRMPRIRFAVAEGLSGGEIRRRQPFDLVCANILAGPLTAMATDMAGVMAPGGMLILSGITRDQTPGVTAAYRAAGFARVRQIILGDWVAALMSRRAARKIWLAKDLDGRG